MKTNLILLTLFFYSIVVYSQTIVDYPNVSGTWTKAGSPYLIQSDLILNQVDTLIIEAGVDVIFQDYYGFEIKGYLTSEGVLGDSVHFTVADTTGYYNNTHTGWAGLWNMDNAPSINLKYTIVEYAKGGGIYADYFIQVKITNSIIRFNDFGIMANVGSGGFNLNHTNVLSNQGNGVTILFAPNAEIRISNFIISNNSGVGILFGTSTGWNKQIFNGQINNNGSGIYLGDDAGGPVLIENVIIQGNKNGGGIMAYERCQIVNCKIIDNIGNNGGGLSFGLYPGSNCAIYNCIIANNIALNDGGGIYHNGGGALFVQNSIIQNNYALNGAGIYSKLSGSVSGRFENVVISSNQALYKGGGLYVPHITTSPAILSGVTIISNQAVEGAGIYCDPLHFFNTVTLNNSIIWDNSSDQVWDNTGNLLIEYSNIQGGFPGTGNINLDPNFINTGFYPSDLDTNSPCINAGNPEFIPTINTDLAGRPRIINDTVDMGAFEAAETFGPSYQLDSKVLLTGAFNGDNMTTFLKESDLIPTNQPFSSNPWYYLGTESVSEIPDNDIADWLLMEFRKASDSNQANDSSVVFRSAAFVRSDGTIVDTSGFRKPVFQNIEDSLYLVVHHRNHKRILSSGPLPSEDYTFNFDFTSSPNNVYGGDKSLMDLGNDKWGMIPGNGVNDDQINNQDKNDNWYIQNGQSGYLQGDYNLDGMVDENDLNEVWNLSVGMGSELPAYQEPQVWQCGDTLVDDRDNQKYTTVLIGYQCWMAQSLNYGTMVNTAEDQSDNGIIEKHCINNLEEKCDIYGGSYQWGELMDYSVAEGSQGICPDGWYVPSDAEWCELENFVDSDTVDCNGNNYRGTDGGGHLKSTDTSLWLAPNTGATDIYGFGGLPGGYYDYTLFQIDGEGLFSQFWTSSFSQETGKPIMRGLQFNLSTIRRYRYNSPEFGHNLRCIREME